MQNQASISRSARRELLATKENIALTGGNQTLFTITGEVIINRFVCLFTEASNISSGTPTAEVGINTDTDLFAQALTTFANGDVWLSSGGVKSFGTAFGGISANGGFISEADIIHTVGGTGAHGAGKYTAFCLWQPVSDDGQVVAT